MGHMRCVYSALSNCPNRSWSKCLHTENWDGGGGLGVGDRKRWSWGICFKIKTQLNVLQAFPVRVLRLGHWEAQAKCIG